MYLLLEEIWIEIFSYLDPRTRQDIISLVCKDWLDINRNNCRHLKIKRIVFRAEINSMLTNNWPKLKVTNAVSICAWFLKCQFGSLLQTWKKSSLKQTWFFLSSSNLTFTACVAFKNQFRNQINFFIFSSWYFEIEKNQVKHDISKIKWR